MINQKFITYLPVIEEILELAKNERLLLDKNYSGKKERDYLIINNIIANLEGIHCEIKNSSNRFYKP